MWSSYKWINRVAVSLRILLNNFLPLHRIKHKNILLYYYEVKINLQYWQYLSDLEHFTT